MKLLNEANVNIRAYKANTTTFASYWLASRLVYWDNTSGWYFGARIVDYKSNKQGSGFTVFRIVSQQDLAGAADNHV